MFKTIVVGTDGTETADRAVARAAELAALTGAHLHVVSAYRPAPVRVGDGSVSPRGRSFASAAITAPRPSSSAPSPACAATASQLRSTPPRAIPLTAWSRSPRARTPI